MSEKSLIKVEYPPRPAGSLLGKRIPIAGSPTQESIVREMLAVSASDLETHPIYMESEAVRELARLLGIKSMLVVPMIFRNRVIGTVSVDVLRERKAFPPSLVETYQTIANQAAVAIEHARLYETGRRLTQQTELLLGSTHGRDAQVMLEAEAARVLGDLREIVEFQKAGLQLIESNERILLAAMGYERRSASRQLLSRVEHDPTIQEIVESRTAKIIPDTCAPSSGWVKGPETWDVNSWMGIPLVANGITIAVITLDHSVHGYFGGLSRETSERLRSRIDQAALDLQAALLQRHIRGLELLQSIASNVLRASEIDDVLEQIVRGAMQVTRRDSGVIFIINNDKITYRFSPRPEDHPTPRMNLESGITQTVMRTKSPVEIPDITPIPEVNPALKNKYKSVIGIPLLLDGTVVGVLYLNGREEGYLTDTERSMVQALVDQAAIVVERLRLYQQIKDSAAEYHSLLDHIPQRVFRKDMELRFTSANQAFCESVGLPWDEIRGKNDFDFYETSLANDYRADDQRVLRGETLQQDERHQTRNMKEPIWVRVVKTPVRDAEGEVTGVQAIFWDVSLEKELSVRYEGLVQQSPDAIVLHRDGRILLANPAAFRLFGVASLDEIKGRSILDFIYDEDRTLASNRLDKLIREEQVEEMMEMRIKGGDGLSVDVAVYTRRLPDSNEIQVFFHDLTSINNVLKEMRHRVKDALNGVKGCLPRRGAHRDRRIEAIVNSVELRIQAMARLHEILLQQRHRKDVSMKRYLADLVELVWQAYGDGSEGISRTVEVEEDLRFEEKPARWVGLIVNELVSNALLHGLHGRESGRIRVVLRRRGDHSCFLGVSDDGKGREAKEGDSPKIGLSLVRGFVKHELRGAMKHLISGRGTAVGLRFRPEPMEVTHAV